uniref:PH domain-containing protein n=1 Tax=Ascaris lumbricoides TaxID=6252 RepID=A0A0M3HNR8_ASCLU
MQSRRLCQWHRQLAAEKEALVERKKRRIMAEVGNGEIVRVRSKKPEPGWINGTVNRISTTSSGPSRARIGVSHLSVPLAWNSDEHFGTRGEGRMYSMFAVLQTTSNVIDSRIVTAIDRTCTDVNFPESFIFENQTVDFEIEISLYSARTDNHGDINQSLKTKLTRSLGRKLGAAYRSNLSNEDAIFDPSVTCPDTAANASFRLLGRTILTLQDAKPRTGIYDLRLSSSAESYGPPLYGHIRCRVVAQPNSVVMPLSEGVLTVRPFDEERVYQNVRCRLQAGVLSCSTSDPAQSTRSEQTVLHIYFTKDSRVISSAYAKSIIVTSDRYLSNGRREKQYLLTADSEEDIAAWKHAFNLQICDCERWGEFAVSSVKLTSEPRSAQPATVSRTNGRRLYDEIQINSGSTSIPSCSVSTVRETYSPYRYLPEPSTFAPFSPPAKVHQTAPPGRRRSRAPVQTLFQPAADGEPRYIINLAVGDVNGSSSTPIYCETNPSQRIQNDEPADIWQRRNYQHSESSESQDSGRFKGLRKSWQRSFGALLSRKTPIEVARF